MTEDESIKHLYTIFVKRLVGELEIGTEASKAAPFLNVVRQFLKDNNITSVLFRDALHDHSDNMKNFMETGDLSDEERDILVTAMGGGTA